MTAFLLKVNKEMGKHLSGNQRVPPTVFRMLCVLEIVGEYVDKDLVHFGFV
ncbi:unnamed protein product [Absidia cylindrospora]